MSKMLNFWLVSLTFLGAGYFAYKAQDFSQPISDTGRQVIFPDSAFKFDYYEKVKVLHVYGIWNPDDVSLLNLPHSVEIYCNYSKNFCKTYELYVHTKENKDYIHSNRMNFEIAKWTDKEIVARYESLFQKYEDKKLRGLTLYINIPNKSVKIASFNNSSENEKRLFPRIDNGMLVDGSDKAIPIGDKQLIWSD